MKFEEVLFMRRMQYRMAIACISIIIAGVIAGCAAPVKKEEAKVFYPDPPALPRVQFLTSYTGSNDIEPPKSGFDVFITGDRGGKLRLDKPYGVAMYNGKLYVCDTNQTILVFDFEKKTFKPLQAAVTGIGKVVQPLNISVDQDGNKVVADPVGGKVVLYDKNDFYVTSFAPSLPWKPVDAVLYEGRVYVVDIKNFEIDVFDKASGNLVKTIGKGKPDESLGIPTNLAIDKDGYLYVSDAGRFQIMKYDRDGHFRGAIGELGTEPGHFARPRGIAIDRENRIYAVDAAFDNIQMFLPNGELLFYFGKAGRSPGDLYLPARVFVDYDDVKYFEQFADPNFQIDHLIFVTNQFGDKMVNVYGFGREKGKNYPSDEEIRKNLIEKIKQMEGKKPANEGAEKK